jgi:CTP synthase
MVELENHPWFVGCQFHPEYKSRPMAPHPLFREFIRACRDFSKTREEGQSQATQASTNEEVSSLS